MDCTCPTTLDYLKEVAPIVTLVLGPTGLGAMLLAHWMGKRQPRPEEAEVRAENTELRQQNTELRRASQVPPAPPGNDEGSG